MINRACKAFPGVIVSLMLAAPSFAATAPAEPAREPHARHAAARPVVARKRVARPVAPSQSLHQVVSERHSGEWTQSGMASWYGGKRWHGKMTASGVRYDEAALTAAHATLPIGSRVRVVDDRSGRSILVTINDRPGTRKRIIDLSRGAAQALGIIDRGVARVTLLPG